MATRVLADEDLEALRGFPDIGREELARFFTLTPADVAFIDPGRGRGPADRVGLAVTLCSLPWLGFVPDDVAAAPQAAVVRLAGQLQVDPDALRLYGRRAKTRTEHLRLAARYLGWRAAGPLELKELDEFLLARALEHDSPLLLFRLTCRSLTGGSGLRERMWFLAAADVAALAMAADTRPQVPHALAGWACGTCGVAAGCFRGLVRSGAAVR